MYWPLLPRASTDVVDLRPPRRYVAGPMRPSLAALLCTLLFSACATTGAGGEPNYAQDAQANLQRGNEALENKDYLEAQRYFEHVRNRYPFLEVAKEAELRLADTLFAREQYIEARDAYQNFLKLNPTWPRADHAAFRAALTWHREIPSDLFILPPSEEKDQVAVRNSVRAMSDFLRRYPDSEYAEEAKKIVADGRVRLAKHELYVASFYARRERWRAVANRLETVATQYQGLGFDEQALFGLYEAYTRLDEKERAKAALEQIIQRLPGTAAAQRAQALLGRS
jgi:outer membrane protein assembly factor BamD